MVDFKNDENLSVLNHSCAHVMAQAVKHLYPQAKFWVGPVVSEGFYYDIDLGDEVIRDEDLPKIEKEMKKICKDGKRITREEISKEVALDMFKEDEYKVDLISNLEDGTITDLGKLSTVKQYLHEIHNIGINPLTISARMDVPKVALTNLSGGANSSEIALPSLVDIIKAYGKQMEYDRQYGISVTEEDLRQIEKL